MIFLKFTSGQKFIFGINQHSRALAKIIKVADFIDEFSEFTKIDGIRVFHNFFQIDSTTVIINASTIKPHSPNKRLNATGISSIHIFNFIEHFINIQKNEVPSNF